MKRIPAAWQQWQSYALWKRISVYLLMSLVLLLMALPLIIERSLEAWMKHEGAKKAQIQEVDINLFRGRIAIKGLYAEVGDRPPLQLGYLNFNLQWLALLKQRVAIKTLEIHDVKADVVLSPEQSIRVGGFRIPLGSQDSSDQNDSPSDWGIGIETLSLVDSTVHIIKPSFDKEIDFHRVSLSHFESWEPDKPARLSFDIDVGEGTFVGNFDLKYFNKTRVADGTVIFDDVFLQSYQPLFNDQLAIADAQLDGRLSVVIEHTLENDHVTVTNQGYLEVNQLHLQQPLSEGMLASQADQVRWEGYFKVNYTPEKAIFDTGSRVTLKNGQYQTASLSALMSSLQVDGQYNGHYLFSNGSNPKPSGDIPLLTLVTDQTIQIGQTQIGLNSENELKRVTQDAQADKTPVKQPSTDSIKPETHSDEATASPSTELRADSESASDQKGKDIAAQTTSTDPEHITAKAGATSDNSDNKDPVKTLSQTLDATHTGRTPAATAQTQWVAPNHMAQQWMFDHLKWQGKTDITQKAVSKASSSDPSISDSNRSDSLLVVSQGQLNLKRIGWDQRDQQISIDRVELQGPIEFENKPDFSKLDLTEGKMLAAQIRWHQATSNSPNANAKAPASIANASGASQTTSKAHDERTATLKKATWEGALTWQIQKEETHLSNQSHLVLESADYQQSAVEDGKKAVMNIRFDKADYQTKLALQPSKDNQSLTSDDQLTMDGVHFDMGALSLLGQRFIWNGNTSTKLARQSTSQGTSDQDMPNQDKDKPRVDVRGNASLVSLEAGHKAVRLNADRADWGGKIQYRPQTQQTLVVKGQGRLAQTTLMGTKNQVTVAALDSFKAHIDFITPRDVGLSDFELIGVDFAKRQQDKRPLAKIQRVKIDTFRMPDETNLKLGHVLVSGLDADVQMTADQKIPPLEAALSAMDSQESQAVLSEAKKKIETLDMTEEEAKAQGKTKFNMHVKSLSVKGKNVVVASTATTEPPVSKTIEIEKAQIGAMDTDKPTQSTPLDLTLKIDKYSTATLHGKAQLFNPKVNADFQAKVDDLNLYSFSPLIQKHLGYRIQSGSLTLDSDTEIKNDDLKSKNHIVLTGFEMQADAPSEVKADKSAGGEGSSNVVSDNSGGQAIPPFALKLGLDMLRDNSGRIEMDLPVKGNLNDPSFDLSTAVNTATRNVLKSGTKVALTLALQPFGSIVLASEFLYGQMSRINFEPVVFEVGKAQMEPKMFEYLDKLTKVMKDKKTIALKVCGYYNDEDERYWQQQGLKDKELTQKLKDLAQARQQLVKDGLIRRGITSNRMTTCYPDRQDKPKPGVSLAM